MYISLSKDRLDTWNSLNAWLCAVISLQVITMLMLDVLKIVQWRSRKWIYCIYSIAICGFIESRLAFIDMICLCSFPLKISAHSLALTSFFIYVPYRFKSEAYSASYIKVHFAIYNWIGWRPKRKQIIIES